MISRRTALVGLAGLTAASPVLAKAPLARQQVAQAYRLRVGRFEVIALGDGYLDIPPSLFPEADSDTVDDLARRSFLKPGPIPTAVNAFAINTGEMLYLVDAGCGGVRGPALGHLTDSLRAVGLDPAQVDAVLMTHLHIDHAAGLRTASGAAAFPNAELLVAEAEKTFWFDPGLPSRASAMMQPMISNAAASLAPYASRTTLFTPGREIAPGITCVPLPGHTPGHTGFLIESDGESLLIWGDIIHVGAYQFPRPDLSIAFDVDMQTAAATRLRMFEQAVSERILIAGMHVSFPGLGHVVRNGKGFAFAPLAWQPLA